MPYSFEVITYTKNDGKLAHPCGYLLYSSLLSIISSNDAKIGDLIHNSDISPITISTLWTNNSISSDFINISKFLPYRFRISCLDSSLYEFTSNIILDMFSKNTPFYLNNIEFFISNINTESPLTKAEEYIDLFDNKNSYTIKFSSPTAFKQAGSMTVLPIPDLVYNSLWRKWKVYANIDIDEKHFNNMKSNIMISNLNIHTRAWKFPKMTVRGFVGVVTFELKNANILEDIKLFNALSKFAFYSGVGIKTSMGMGQCRLINLENNL